MHEWLMSLPNSQLTSHLPLYFTLAICCVRSHPSLVLEDPVIFLLKLKQSNESNLRFEGFAVDCGLLIVQQARYRMYYVGTICMYYG
jgi:hypothetical protein